MRSIIGSIFTAIFSAEVSNTLPHKLSSIALPAVVAAGLPESSTSDLLTAITAGTQAALETVPGMNDTILSIANDKISDAYAAAYAYVDYTAMALGAVAVIAAFCLRDFDQYLDNHVSRQIYHKGDTAKDILELVNADTPVARSSDEHGKTAADPSQADGRTHSSSD